MKIRHSGIPKQSFRNTFMGSAIPKHSGISGLSHIIVMLLAPI